METRVWTFPITGSHVSEVIGSRFAAEAVWRVADLDVPSGPHSSVSLTELREKMEQGGADISTRNLCEALVGATQVWVLDVRLVSNPNIQLYIEDGEVFEAMLGP